MFHILDRHSYISGYVFYQRFVRQISKARTTLIYLDSSKTSRSTLSVFPFLCNLIFGALKISISLLQYFNDFSPARR